MNTIVALSTPYGTGGIAVIRVSGPEAVSVVSRCWKGADLTEVKSHTAHLGDILAADGTVLDNAVLTIFRGPKSYTGEDTVEISIHGSKWLQRQIVDRIAEAGARPAEPGEFTRRAFINGRIDLAQAEGIADLLSASSRAAHRLAVMQMNGSFSARLDELRDRLVELASLLELELDFSEEEVEFADRDKLCGLTEETLGLISCLASTYKSGKVFKEGVPVAIAGRPNAGKSTLLNALLDEDKAIVSDVPGTTRDVIEDTVEIGGILFRFYDTAGLRSTSDSVEQIGIERARSVISRAAIVLWLVDPTDDVESRISEARMLVPPDSDKKLVIVFTKSDLVEREEEEVQNGISISVKEGTGLDKLKSMLVKRAGQEHDPESELIVTNARHYAALNAAADSLRRAREGLREGISADFLSQDIREAISYLSEITGRITTETLLQNIFANFCIGK